MWGRVAIVASILCPGLHAFAPIQYVGARSSGFVLVPKRVTGLPGSKEITAPGVLTISRADDEMPPILASQFTVKPDKTISWALDVQDRTSSPWCVEAGGDQNGDAVRLSQCNGGQAQKWDWIPDGQGRNMIQLKGSSKCLDVVDREGSLDGAVVALRECEQQGTDAWKFEMLTPISTESPAKSSSFPFDIQHVLISLLGMSGAGLLSLSAWLWRHHSEGPKLGLVVSGAQLSPDQEHGLSLTTSSVAPMSYATSGNSMTGSSESKGTRSLSVRRGNVFMQADDTDEKSAQDMMVYLAEQKDLVEAALDAALSSSTPFNAKLVESMRYSLLAGGKRLRPILCLAAYEMIADKGSPSADVVAMPTAVALEMIHTMSLIHDDLPCMDGDDLRRGMPTNHVKYGEATATLAGDSLLSESFTHVASKTPASVPPDRLLDVIQILGIAVGADGLCGGQIQDLQSEGKKSATTEELQWIHEHKTSVLLEASVVTGAVLAGASPSEIEACKKYAECIGLAFQVVDDILDVTQTTEELGKTAGKDEAVDKTTYVKLYGIDGAKKEAERLRSDAVDYLGCFGSRAKPLIAIGDLIVNRTN